MKAMGDVPVRDRPREKLLNKGVASLSDLELLAVILGRGARGKSVLILAAELLTLFDRRGGEPGLDALLAIKGMGPARAGLITAIMEFSRRRIRPAGLRIEHPTDILPLVRHYADRKQEYLLCTSLNGGGEIIATRVVTVGLVDRNQVHPREVFAEAITDRAAAVIVAHNHPSGNVQPSLADTRVTKRLAEAGRLLGIDMLDHIIFTHAAYFSFAEAELM